MIQPAGITMASFRRAVLGVAAMITFAAGPASADASEYVFTPVADTRVNAASPGTGYGKAKVIVLDSTPENRGYLRFDLRGVEGNVTQATLRFHALTTNSGNPVALRAVPNTT